MNKNVKRKNVNKRKGNFNTVILILLLVIGIFWFTQNCVANKQIQMKEVYVNNNDTLWSIAGKICENDDKLNIQNVIIEIKKINKLEDSNIYVGQTLFVPEY